MNIAEQVIRAKQDLDDVYSAGQSSMVDESKLIPKTVEGSYISVDDVSEIPHSVGCKVESVNLCPEEVKSGRYYDATPNESGADAGYIRILPFAVKPLTTYTFSSNLYAYSIWCCGADGGIERIGWTNSYVRTITTPENCTELRISLTNRSGVADTTAFEYAMLNRGTTALPYTPYVKPEEVTVTRCGKNIVDILNGAIQYKTVTIREKTENTIVLSCTGTYKGVCYILPKNLVGKYLTVSGEWDNANGANGGLRISWIKTNNAADLTVVNIGTGTSGKAASGLVKPPPSDAAFLGLIVYGNSDGSIEGEGVVSYRNIQVEINDKETEREPYNGQTLTPAADGTVEGMASVSPYMNIFSDTEGVNIEATYNKSYGMQTEWDRFWDNYQDYGKRTDYTYFAANVGWNDTTFRPKYSIVPTAMNFAFANNAITNLDGVLKKRGVALDTSQCTKMVSAFQLAPKLTKVPKLDLSNVSGADANNLFNDCPKLVEIEGLVFNENITPSQYTFYATTLQHITFEGVIGNSVDFRYSPLTKASITNIINTLSSTATGQTLTLKLSAVNTAFETSAGANDGSTSAEFAALVATKTNWTITMI